MTRPPASPQGPTFAITDPWLRGELARGRGYTPTVVARYELDPGIPEFIDPDTGEVLTHNASRGVRRALLAAEHAAGAR